MKRLLALLAVVLAGAVAAPAWSAPTKIGGPTGVLMRDYTIQFDATTADSPAFETVGQCTFKFVKVGTGSVSVYSVATRSTATGSGTLIATLSTDGQRVSVTPSTRWARAVASGTGLSGSVLIAECPALSASVGGNVDADGNGLYESAYIFDADQDGSTYVTCTAKDTPDSACKVAGEVIYRDMADDINCMIRGCGSVSASMEHSGVIFLRPGPFMNFPCWSPGGANDPTDPTSHDDPGDAAYGDCPDGENGLKQSLLTLAGWGGTIVGAGAGQGRSDTSSLSSRGYGRTDGTYIVNDLGNTEDEWFLASSTFHKSIAFGYPLQDVSVSKHGTAAWFGTPGGWGTIEAIGGTSQEVETLTTATICVCNAASCTRSNEATATGSVTFGIQSIDTNTKMLIEHDVSDYSTRTAVSIVTARSAPPYTQGSCGTGHVAVPIGLTDSGITGNGALPGGIQQIIDNAGQLYILRDDYFDSAAQITNVTFEPQDWWNEAGGDCADTGVYVPASSTSTDADCDSVPMATVHGFNGRPALQDVQIKHWMHYAVDGESTPTMAWPTLERVVWIEGQGGAISDPGHGWRTRSLQVMNTVFAGFVVENFGVGRYMEDLAILNSTFDRIMTFNGHTNDVWRKIRIEGSEFISAFGYGCGNKSVWIDDLYSTGRFASNKTEAGASTAMEALISLSCDDETHPSDALQLTNIREDSPGSSVNDGAYQGAGQVLIRVRVTDPDTDYANLGHVFVSNSSVLNDRVPALGNPYFQYGANGTDGATDVSSCLIGIEDRSSAGSGSGTQDGLQGSDGTAAGELDTLQLFKLVGNQVNGHLFCVFGASGMYDTVEQCIDINDTGGPPQTSGPADGFCDSDGTTAVTPGTSESAAFNAHWTLMRELNQEF